MSLIYKIYCKDSNIKDCYIGSTNNLTNRKRSHKFRCNNPIGEGYNLKVYTFIRANGGYTNWEFEVLETFNTIDKQDLHKIERKYIESNNSTLNNDIPTRTKQEYSKHKKEYFKEYHQEYYINNKEVIQQKIKCECGCMINSCNIIRHKKSKRHIELMENK